MAAARSAAASPRISAASRKTFAKSFAPSSGCRIKASVSISSRSRGTKAAAVWLRANVPAGGVVFTDPFAGPGHFAAMYYLHRPILSLELAPGIDFDDAHDLLAEHAAQVDAVLVGAENFELILPDVAETFAVRGLCASTATSPW